ncbi:MAG: leucyl/phenylalanyl-tRNA--protein transferase [Chromatiaceae bacterium]|nr:leucyl/phenylalanyl-tRNA--protein transferase [Chromatiaceae bacterium]
MIFDLDGTPADIGFPDTRLAETDPNGLLAIGGDLSPQRLLLAYRQGIFPWYSAGQPILWWSPAPRMVLYPRELHVSRSLRQSLRRRHYEVSVNQSFERVIRACAAPRGAAGGTWLVPEMIGSYLAFHHAGHAHSLEVWRDDELIGGLYGIAIGQMFFGESMFSRQTDASKVALCLLAEIAARQPYQLIDCQVYTDHLASLGAREISRAAFQVALQQAAGASAAPLGRQPRRPAADLEWAA